MRKPPSCRAHPDGVVYIVMRCRDRRITTFVYYPVHGLILVLVFVLVLAAYAVGSAVVGSAVSVFSSSRLHSLLAAVVARVLPSGSRVCVVLL